MKSPRENLLSLYRKKGYDYAPVYLDLCPSKVSEFKEKFGDTDYRRYFGFPEINVPDLIVEPVEFEKRLSYIDNAVPGITFDIWGIGYEPGSEACAHMKHFRHPMKNFTTISEFENYPYPAYLSADASQIKTEVERIHGLGYAASASMACTVWEIAWYLRSMEQLMADMMLDEDLAEYHFDRITEISCHRASVFASAGVDIILTGDDVGMQSSLMMSEDMYCRWIKPRFAKIIAAAKRANPDVLIEYHSCGYVEPLIHHFIDCGIDILNPIQPECMNFTEIHEKYGSKLSFKGTIGIQTTMPFGSPEEVKKAVKKNLDTAGSKGGLYCCPTHMIEPEVPWENIIAYIEACNDYKP
ncbi:MAG: hypothetical protein JW903_05905 [Clostridia bacterium]|nr:hypothetical protein [Clostridia bacterium]